MIKCSKCGAECSDKALFCSSCGKSLADERGDNKTYKCSKCGATFKGKKAFCENCGTKFVWQDKPEEIKEQVKQTSSAAEVQKQSTANKVMNIITYSISFAVIVLSMIAIWLNFSEFPKVLGAKFPVDFGVNIYFEEMWKEEALTLTYMPGFIMFVLAIILTYTFGIVALVKQIKSGVKKEFKVSTTALSFVAIPPLVSQILSCSVICIRETSGGETAGTSFGPGTILSIVSVSILFVVIVLSNIFNKIKSANDIVSSIFKYIVSFIFIFVAIFMFPEVRAITEGTMKETTNINLPIILYYNAVKHTNTGWITMIFEMIIQVAAVIVLFATALFSFIGINDKEYSATRVTLSSISLALIVGFMICFFAGADNIKTIFSGNFNLSSHFIVGLVLCLLGFGLSIASAALDSKQEA